MNYFIAFIFGILLFYIFQHFPFSTSLLLLLSCVFLILNKRTILIILILSGILYGLLRHDSFQVEEIAGSQLRVRLLVNERVSESRQGGIEPTLSGILYRSKIISAIDCENNRAIKGLDGRDAVLISGIELENKEVYSLIVRVSLNRVRYNPGSYKERAITLYLEKNNGIERIQSDSLLSTFSDVTKVIENERERLDRYLKGLSNDSGAFLSSIITGKRSGLGEDIRESFSRTGLAHILSISGTHFGLLSTFLFFLIRSSISFLPHPLLRRLTIFLTPSQVAAILSLPFLILYLLISGASIPAIRSFIMINIFLFGLLMGRRGYWLNSLLFAASMILLWDPSSINDISFQLSFIAVLLLGHSLKETDQPESSDKTEKGVKGLLKVIPIRLKKTFLISLSVSLGTAPLVAYYFHYFSIIAPIVNILLTPLICLIILPVALFSSFLFILTGYFPFERL
ncbi:MAG: ComEC/Rec2 family competence protein, partial [Thermodesulfovibrionales bacterium]